MSTREIKDEDFSAELTRILDKQPEDRINQQQGIAGSAANTIVPKYIASERGTLYDAAATNAYIALEPDRNSDRFSGHGGAASSPSRDGSIRLVAGLMGNNPRDTNADPDFKTDAATVYISQTSDIDKYLELTPGTVGSATARSAVALKADAIRLVSRDGGIKIISSVDNTNSQGGIVESITGIDLIAGNRTEGLQPLPKGKNLIEAMSRLTDHVDKLNGIVDHLLTTQMNFNESLTHHFHYSPWYGNPTTPSDAVVGKGVKTMVDFLQETKRSLITHKTNLVNFKQTYLEPSGRKYINSRFNNVN